MQGGGATATAPAATPKHTVALGVPLTFVAGLTCLHPGDTTHCVPEATRNDKSHPPPPVTRKVVSGPLVLAPNMLGKWSC